MSAPETELLDSDTTTEEIYDVLKELEDKIGTPEVQFMVSLAAAVIDDRRRVPEDDLTGRKLAFGAAIADAVRDHQDLSVELGRIHEVSWDRIGFALGLSAIEAQDRHAQAPCGKAAASAEARAAATAPPHND